MGITADDYRSQLGVLLPKGPAWASDESSTLAHFIDAWSQEFTRIHSRLDALIEDVDPRSTYELLPDYERLFGLPTDCMAGVNQAIEQRRNALVSQMISVGGQSRAYFIELAAAAGFAITITEFTPFTVGMTVVDPIYGENWWFAWQINASLNTVTHFLVTSGVNEALATWGNNLLECLINRYKPAHTITIFSYT